MSNNKHTDIIVIGSGPGGYAAAFRAADLGREVTLVDKDPTLGGVCLNRGCIPSKTLLHISKVLEEAESLKKMGVTFTKPTIDIDLVRDWKNKVVSQLSGGIGQMAKARRVKTIQAEATFLSDNLYFSLFRDRGKFSLDLTFLYSLLISLGLWKFNIFLKQNFSIRLSYFNYIFLAVLFQIILGILTLLSGLNIYLASLHQIGSILLISTILIAIYRSSNLIDNKELKD